MAYKERAHTLAGAFMRPFFSPHGIGPMLLYMKYGMDHVTPAPANLLYSKQFGIGLKTLLLNILQKSEPSIKLPLQVLGFHTGTGPRTPSSPPSSTLPAYRS